MIFTKTKMGADPIECRNEMIKSDELIHQKVKIAKNKNLTILHIDEGDQLIEDKKLYYLTFVYMVEDK